MSISTLFPNDRPAVELVKVTKVYIPDVMALQDISLAVAKGEMLFLTGRSGAGKSTLLKLLCCMELPTKGLIEVGSQDLSRLRPPEIQHLRQQIGMAYQDFKLLPRRSVFHNVAMALEVTFQKPQIIRSRVMELLEMLGLADKAGKLAGKLSRGEQQRVALARAAANRPALLLADEPTGNLDSEVGKLVIELIDMLHQQGTTIIIATHDTSFYHHTPHRVIDLAHGRLNSVSSRADSLEPLQAGAAG